MNLFERTLNEPKILPRLTLAHIAFPPLSPLLTINYFSMAFMLKNHCYFAILNINWYFLHSLYILGMAPYFREKIRNASMKEGDEVVLRCYAIGKPKVDYSWFRNDGILLESSRVVVSQQILSL